MEYSVIFNIQCMSSVYDDQIGAGSISNALKVLGEREEEYREEDWITGARAFLI
jgi:hypothetical protein